MIKKTPEFKFRDFVGMYFLLPNNIYKTSKLRRNPK